MQKRLLKRRPRPIFSSDSENDYSKPLPRTSPQEESSRSYLHRRPRPIFSSDSDNDYGKVSRRTSPPPESSDSNTDTYESPSSKQNNNKKTPYRLVRYQAFKAYSSDESQPRRPNVRRVTYTVTRDNDGVTKIPQLRINIWPSPPKTPSPTRSDSYEDNIEYDKISITDSSDGNTEQDETPAEQGSRHLMRLMGCDHLEKIKKETRQCLVSKNKTKQKQKITYSINIVS
jgi:hypothetical protein